MTPPPKKKQAATKSAKKATKKTAAKKTGKAAKKATSSAPKKSKGPAAKATGSKTTSKGPAAKSTKSTSKAAPAAETLDVCAALTTKGTRCRLKPQEGLVFCARHKDAEAPVAPEAEREVAAVAAVPPATKNGQVAKTERMSLPEVEAEALHAEEAAGVKKPERAKKVQRRGRQSELPRPETPAEANNEDVDEASGSADEEEFVLYGSVYSTTLEASPYEDASAIAGGEEDVELVDEHQMGGGGRRPTRGRQQQRPPQRQQQRPQQKQQPQQPVMTREEAEAKALEKLGPRPNIAPEEDLDEVLPAYDRRFESEVNHLMGLRRKRGRRGGRRRRGGRGRRDGDSGGGGQGGGGGRRGGQGGGGRGGGGGGGRGRRGGGRRGGGGGGGGAPRNVARDSPLANKRSSQGPKRGVQPRRRRDPEV